MKLSAAVRIFILAIFICYVYSLECGIDSTTSQKDFRQIADICMKKNVKEEKKSVSEDPEDEDEIVSTTDSFNGTKRIKRSENLTQNMTQNNVEYKTENNNSTISSTNTTLEQKGNCIIHCIFEHLNMVDNEGYPVHHRLLNALLNNAHGREVRDFVQDTTDECFQLMQQGTKHDPCQYSITLVNCLAERGQSNCADWPIGNLPFLTKKN